MAAQTTAQLHRLLARWDRRLRLQQSFVWGPRGIAAGVAVGVALAVVARFRPWLLPRDLAILAGLAALIGLLLTLVIVWAIRRDPVKSARRFDRRFGLKERVSTALELDAGRIRSPNEEITERQLDDALSRAGSIDARAYLPLRFLRRDWLVLAALVAVLAALLLTANPQNNILVEQQGVAQAIQDQVDALENLREEIANSTELDEAQREEMLQELNEAIDTLQQPDLSQEEAVATLADLAESMEEAAQEQPEIDPAMQQAFAEAAEQLQQNAESIELGEAMEEGAMEDAAQAMEDLAQGLENMTETEQQSLAEALENAAESMAETNPELAESMQEAADALQEGDTEAAQDAMQQAADDMQQQSQDAPQGDGDAGQQMASEVAQQATTGAQQLAEQGSGTAFTQQSAQSPQGNTASPVEMGGQGAPQNQSGPAGQSGQGEQSQGTGEDTGAGNEGGTGQETTEGTAGGSGDSAGQGQEGSFQSSGEQISQGNNPDGQGMTEYEPIFAPQSIGGEGGPQVNVPGSDQPGDIVADEGELSENPEGESIVGYDQVFSDYSDAANEALQSDYIPLNLRDVVHDYFSSLEPAE